MQEARLLEKKERSTKARLPSKPRSGLLLPAAQVRAAMVRLLCRCCPHPLSRCSQCHPAHLQGHSSCSWQGAGAPYMSVQETAHAAQAGHQQQVVALLRRILHHLSCTGLGTLTDEFHYLLPPGHASFPHSLAFPIHRSLYRACSLPKAAPGHGKDRSSKQWRGPSFLTFCMKPLPGRQSSALTLRGTTNAGGKGRAAIPALPVPSSLCPLHARSGSCKQASG